MITKQQKQDRVAVLVEKLQRTQGLYVVDFTGLKVKDALEIRREFRKIGAEFKVAKNTLIQLALNQVGGFPVPEDKFFGQTALVFGFQDPIAPSKVILKYASDKELKLKLKAAVIEGQVFDGSQLKQISELPSREDLIAGILGSLNAPASGIVGAINAVLRDVAYLVEEVAKKKAA